MQATIQWLAGVLNGPAANLLSGLIGAIVGVAGLFAIQGLQTKASNKEAKSAARLIYIEIGHNLAILETMATSTISLPLLVGSGEWDRHSGKLATVMPEPEIARVAAPYVQLNTYRVLFAQPWYYMAVTRLRGYDVEVLNKMADSFRDAETALRPLVWTGSRLAGLTQVMKAQGVPFRPRSIGRRLRIAVSDVPMGVLTLIAATLLGIRGLLWIMDTIRQWLGVDWQQR